MRRYRATRQDSRILLENQYDSVLAELYRAKFIPTLRTGMMGLFITVTSGTVGAVGTYALADYALRDKDISVEDIPFPELFSMMASLSLIIWTVGMLGMLGVLLRSRKGGFISPLEVVYGDNPPKKVGQEVLDLYGTRSDASLYRYRYELDSLVDDLNLALKQGDNGVEDLLVALHDINANPSDDQSDKAVKQPLLKRLDEILDSQTQAQIAQAKYLNEQTAEAALEIAKKY